MIMPIILHDTMTKKNRKFVPIDHDHVRLYVCEPTVYDTAHIGNARPVVVFGYAGSYFAPCLLKGDLC